MSRSSSQENPWAYTLPVDRREVPQALLDVEDKQRTSLFAWRGQFSPQLVECLLAYYSAKGFMLLDPFLGVGTTLLEAARRGTDGCGCEINPAAVSMARIVSFIPLSSACRQEIIDRAKLHLEARLDCPLSLAGLTSARTMDVESLLADLSVQQIEDKLLSNVYANTLIRYFSMPEPRHAGLLGDAFDRYCEAIQRLPYAHGRWSVVHSDARQVPLDNKSVDLVVTSPPYINVFNYHQNNRRSMEMLGWDILTLAKSEIGANRKHRSNRFLTVVQYCVDLAAVLRELRRVIKPDGRVIIVIGRISKVRGIGFRNGEIVAALAGLADFKLILRQERGFRNKFGEMIFEDILHLSPSEPQIESPGLSQVALAQGFLSHALQEAASPDVYRDIEAAIEAAATVCASPLFSLDSLQARPRPSCQQALPGASSSCGDGTGYKTGLLFDP